MIGSLRRKFIRISAISIFLVFAGIFLLLFISAKVPMNRLMDELTDTIVANGGSFPEFDPSEQHLPEIIDAETQYSTRFFTVWLDDAQQITRINMDSVSAISESEVGEYTQRALDKGRERGWIAEYRYKIAETEDGTSVVFVNGAMTQMTTNRVLFTAFFVLLGSAFLILALTIIFSKRAVQPVAESFEKQKQFITDANHELKTPLTLILSNLDIVESEFGKSEWLDDIRSEGERMGLLINRLVTLSRMDESDARLTYTTFSLSDAVADVVSEFEMLAVERDKTLSADIAPSLRCHGDEGLIRQLIAILLDNAVKYCDPNGSIQVRLYARRHPILIVENTYAEVDTLELDRLFDRFYRADKARTFSGSFGVGLSIARSIVKTHHGTINAYRKAGRIGFRTDLK